MGDGRLSVVIRAHDEAGGIAATVRALNARLVDEQMEREVLVVNDDSTDDTEEVLRALQREIRELRHVNNRPPQGFGFAVRKGLEHFEGDAVAVYVADASDRPED